MQINREVKILFIKRFMPGMSLATLISHLGLVENWDDNQIDCAIEYMDKVCGYILDEKTVAELEKVYG